MLAGRSHGSPAPTNLPQKRRPDQQVGVLLLVCELLDDGERVCECGPSPATLVSDERGVLRCPDCAGIEQGQTDQAREHASPEPVGDEVPVGELPALLRFKRVRSERESAVRL